MPLLRLTKNNLSDAHSLGMLECSLDQVEQLHADLEQSWAKTLRDKKAYDQLMGDLKRRLDRNFRPIQAFKGRTIPFCNVLTVGSWCDYWRSGLPPPLPGSSLEQALSTISKLVSTSTTPTSTESDQLKHAFFNLDQWLRQPRGSGRPPGIEVDIGLLLNAGKRTMWVGGKVLKPNLNAQYWRDRLGLIHLGGNTGDCKDFFIRMRFMASLTDQTLNRDRYIEHKNRVRGSVWLYRPSVTDCGNTRFVQMVRVDRATRPSRRGSTRDISTKAYLEGERELLLMVEETARIRLIGIDFLDGIPHSNTHDNDHNVFVEAIAEMNHWD